MSLTDKDYRPPVGTGPGSSGIENADIDRDMTADAETEMSAEAPGNDPAKENKGNLKPAANTHTEETD